MKIQALAKHSKPGSLAQLEPDILAQLLADKRSPNTRHAYFKDLRDFFRFATGAEELTPELMRGFLSLDQFVALLMVLKYEAHLRNNRGLKEATVNRRLSAIKSLVRLGNQLGQCSFTLSEVKRDKVVRYRDTTGVSKEVYRRMLSISDRCLV